MQRPSTGSGMRSGSKGPSRGTGKTTTCPRYAACSGMIPYSIVTFRGTGSTTKGSR